LIYKKVTFIDVSTFKKQDKFISKPLIIGKKANRSQSPVVSLFDLRKVKLILLKD